MFYSSLDLIKALCAVHARYPIPLCVCIGKEVEYSDSKRRRLVDDGHPKSPTVSPPLSREAMKSETAAKSHGPRQQGKYIGCKTCDQLDCVKTVFVCCFYSGRNVKHTIGLQSFL